MSTRTESGKKRTFHTSACFLDIGKLRLQRKVDIPGCSGADMVHQAHCVSALEHKLVEQLVVATKSGYGESSNVFELHSIWRGQRMSVPGCPYLAQRARPQRFEVHRQVADGEAHAPTATWNRS